MVSLNGLLPFFAAVSGPRSFAWPSQVPVGGIDGLTSDDDYLYVLIGLAGVTDSQAETIHQLSHTGGYVGSIDFNAPNMIATQAVTPTGWQGFAKDSSHFYTRLDLRLAFSGSSPRLGRIPVAGGTFEVLETGFNTPSIFFRLALINGDRYVTFRSGFSNNLAQFRISRIWVTGTANIGQVSQSSPSVAGVSGTFITSNPDSSEIVVLSGVDGKFYRYRKSDIDGRTTLTRLEPLGSFVLSRPVGVSETILGLTTVGERLGVATAQGVNFYDFSGNHVG